jgi:hypothetical protein
MASSGADVGSPTWSEIAEHKGRELDADLALRSSAPPSYRRWMLERVTEW